MYTQKISDAYEHSIIIACQKHSDLLRYETFRSLGICTHQQFLTPHEHSLITLGQKESDVMRQKSSHPNPVKSLLYYKYIAITLCKFFPNHRILDLNLHYFLYITDDHIPVNNTIIH